MQKIHSEIRRVDAGILAAVRQQVMIFACWVFYYCPASVINLYKYFSSFIIQLFGHCRTYYGFWGFELLYMQNFVSISIVWSVNSLSSIIRNEQVLGLILTVPNFIKSRWDMVDYLSLHCPWACITWGTFWGWLLDVMYSNIAACLLGKFGKWDNVVAWECLQCAQVF